MVADQEVDRDQLIFEADGIASASGAVSFGMYQVTRPSHGENLSSNIQLIAGNCAPEDYENGQDIWAALLATIEKENRNALRVFCWSESSEDWYILRDIKDFAKVVERSAIALVCQSFSATKAAVVFDIFGIVVDQKFDIESDFDFFHSRGTLLLQKALDRGDTVQKYGLNANERNCLVWCACGKTSNEIAEILNLSEHTVNHYFILASQKLAVNNRAQAVAKAMKLGIVRFEEVF